MTEYKVGQRVRIEWPDGTLVEGVLNSNMQVGRTTFMPYEAGCDGRTVTILAEPRPEEPQGLGAVVEAAYQDHGRQQWVSVRGKGEEKSRWVSIPYWGFIGWDNLSDPVIEAYGHALPPKHGMADVYNLAECRHCGHYRKKHTLSMSGCTACSCSEFEL